MAAINESGDRYLTRAIPRYNVELDCREEGKVNLSVIHVICDALGYWMELREAKSFQIIREMFGGMENGLYLCGDNFNNKICDDQK